MEQATARQADGPGLPMSEKEATKTEKPEGSSSPVDRLVMHFNDCHYYEKDVSKFEDCPVRTVGPDQLSEHCLGCPYNTMNEEAKMSWPDVAWVVKWTLENARHLESGDTYLIEKEVDRCHLEYMRMKNK